MDSKLLEKKWPKLEVRNRTNEQKHIQYNIDADGDGLPDSITINPGARRLIPSKNLLQIPNIMEFELLNPTLFDLKKAGVIQLGEQKASEDVVKGEEPEMSIADSAAEAGVIANANQRSVVGSPDDGSNPDATVDALVASRPMGVVPPGEKGRQPNVTVQEGSAPRNRR